jgi:hypothetical protein
MQPSAPVTRKRSSTTDADPVTAAVVAVIRSPRRAIRHWNFVALSH